MLSLLFISCRKDYISLLDWKTEMRSEFVTSIFYPLAAAWTGRSEFLLILFGDNNSKWW
jgi:hypothetical protein